MLFINTFSEAQCRTADRVRDPRRPMCESTEGHWLLVGKGFVVFAAFHSVQSCCGHWCDCTRLELNYRYFEMNTDYLKDVLDALVELKASLHDVADTSAKQKLDEAIKLVQQCIEKGKADTDTKNRILFAVGKVLEAIPSIAAILRMFSD